jgi:hypothetical protein
MAHFARVNDENIVEYVMVVDNQDCGNLDFPESETIGRVFIGTVLRLPGKWYQTSYNNNFRKNYAGVDYTYDKTRDAFIAPKPYSSWILNEETCKWEAPIPMPDSDHSYKWDEENQEWILREV